jgi:shikimate dehydrogenase
MRKFGLIGFPLTHSFSRKYFTQKFEAEHIPETVYELYELPDLQKLPELIRQDPELQGLSVTIPHKQNVIPLLDELDETAAKIGAVNTIKISGGKLKGYNTDVIGFRESLRNFLPAGFNSKAIILGTGGAAQAVKAALQELGIPFQSVSRNSQTGDLTYEDMAPEILAAHHLIINATPLGTFPEVETFPAIPYEFLTPQHFLFDLVYNPEETQFMKNGRAKGAKTQNGYEMLVLQAEAAWQIWNN